MKFVLASYRQVPVDDGTVGRQRQTFRSLLCAEKFDTSLLVAMSQN